MKPDPRLAMERDRGSRTCFYMQCVLAAAMLSWSGYMVWLVLRGGL